MCTTLALRKRTMTSPSVCAFLTCTVEARHELVHAEAFAHVLVGHDDGAGLPPVLVPARVVLMPMGVEDETERPAAEGADGGLDFRLQRRVLVVNQEHAVRAGRPAAVPPPPHQHGHPA